MKKILILLSILLFVFHFTQAQQVPVSAELNVNNVRATINSNGTLFNNLSDDSGQFLIEAANATLQSTLKKSGLWIAGTDPAGNTFGSFVNQDSNEDNSFVPTDDLNKIWRVTKQDIEQHRADFADNGVIDQINENIFAWPGIGNDRFEEFNPGIANLPYDLAGLGAFFDEDANGSYSPMQGDYPIVPIRGFVTPITPDEMLFMVFTDRDLGLDLPNFGVRIRCTVFAYNCAENNPIDNTIFVNYSILYTVVESSQNVFLGVLNDFQIGAEEDEFFGSVPTESIAYAYNGDNTDTGGFEITSPVMAFQMLSGPIAIEDNAAISVNAKFIKPIQNLNELSGLESYNILRGNNPDGTLDSSPDFLYPDNPNDINGDSEVSANNQPGQRQVISSFGPLSFAAGQVNDFLVAYTAYQKPQNTALENVDLFLNEQLNIVKDFYESGFLESELCSASPVSTKRIIKTQDIKVSPNTSNSIINISTSNRLIQSFKLIGLNGQLVKSAKWIQAQTTYALDVSDIQSGMYILHLTTEDGKIQNEKIVVLE